MPIEVTKNGTRSLIPEIAAEIFNNLNSGLIIFGEDDALNDINQRGLDVIHSAYPEINSLEQAKELTIDKIFSEKNFPGWLNKFELVKNASDVWLTEYLVSNINDQDIIYSVKAGKISSKSEGPLFVIIFYDVTNEKKSQHRLAWIEKQAEKGSMASITVHDLNNYLSLLLGGAELTELMLNSGKMEKAIEKIEKLKENVKKMEIFIAGFTDEYKIVTNKQKADFNKLISNIVSFLSPSDGFVRISIYTELDLHLPEFEFDIDQLSGLLLNLLNNSADAIEDSETKQGRITIKTEFDSGKVYLTVSDNGPGLMPDVKEKIFKRRFTTKKNHTGYGLMTCSSIVSNHNGQIEIVENINEGAAFRVMLPVA
ncbi:MAG: ATP-binding protein [bacterium]